jgi:hypothetical protein
MVGELSVPRQLGIALPVLLPTSLAESTRDTPVSNTKSVMCVASARTRNVPVADPIRGGPVRSPGRSCLA